MPTNCTQGVFRVTQGVLIPRYTCIMCCINQSQRSKFLNHLIKFSIDCKFDSYISNLEDCYVIIDLKKSLKIPRDRKSKNRQHHGQNKKRQHRRLSTKKKQ